MTKISVTGSKKDLDNVIDRLYTLEALDIENYEGELDTGNPFDEAENVSELLVDIRSVLSKLPAVDSSKDKNLNIEQLQENIRQISKSIEEIEDDKSEIGREISSLKDQKKFYRKLEGTDLDYSDLKGLESLSVFIGKLKQEQFERSVPSDLYEIYEGKDASVVFYKSDTEGFEQALRNSKIEEYNLVDTEFEGSVESILSRIIDKRERLKRKNEQKDEELKDISNEWRSTLESVEGFLAERIEKAEAPMQFATTENAFIAEGWIPSERYREVEEELAEAVEGRIHVQREEGGEPPVKHNNNRAVKPFEDLVDLVSVPKYNELDPSFALLLTFPLFFGFMIGDAGYGITSLMVFIAGMKMFPAAADVFKSLMWCSVATVFFGLIYGDAFGYIIFGESSVLTQVTGMEIFSQIPVIYHRVDYLDEVFTMALAIGVIHVNFGILLGMYNEYVRHDFKEAVLAKGSWIILEAGALAWYLAGSTVGAPIMLLAAVMLYLGEGIEGVVEIPSLLSNIISYLRIFGVSVAAISLATVVNAIAAPLFQTGTAVGTALGIIMLTFGHVFNTFIKIMEGAIQGIRLHYVEMFGWFYEGGGKKYAPFGAN